MPISGFHGDKLLIGVFIIEKIAGRGDAVLGERSAGGNRVVLRLRFLLPRFMRQLVIVVVAAVRIIMLPDLAFSP